MHASIYVTRATRVSSHAGSAAARSRWVDLTEPDHSTVTLYMPADAAEAVAACGALVDAIESIRRAALGSLAEQVKADLPEDAPDLPDTTGYGRLGAAWAQQSRERRQEPDLPEDAVCEDPDLGTWSPGELVEAYGS